MYQINRGEHIVETVRIIGTDGEFVDFKTDISVDDILREFTEVMRNITAAQNILEAAKTAGDADTVEQTYNALGAMVCALVRMTFGTENGAKLLLLYRNAYVELLSDILPFIREVVAPKVSARLDEQAAKYTAER